MKQTNVVEFTSNNGHVFLHSYPEDRSIMKLLGVVEDDTVLLSRLGVWYALACLVMYLLVYAVMNLAIPLISLPLSVWGRIFAWINL